MCSVNSCSRPVKSKGLCSKHYMQLRRTVKVQELTRKDFNAVVNKGSYYELILTDLKMNETGRAKIDKEDLAKVQAVGRWYLNNTDGYVINSNTRTTMHRLILAAKDDEEVDHVETGIEFRSDNRKSNIRLCSGSDNGANKSKQVNNTSGFKGVHYNKRDKNWRAEIQKNKKRIHLGSFETPEKAYKAYLAAANNVQGRFMHKSLKTEIE